MKTPMEELIEKLKDERSKLQVFNERVMVLTLDYAIADAELMLEKEKEVMCEFADNYRDDSCYATIQGGVSSEETTEEFFNKTFKTKEK